MDIEIIRTKFSKLQTLGNLVIYDRNGKPLYECKTLELDMNGNKEGESCIPYGVYDFVPLRNRPDHVRFSEENYGYFPYLVKDVPNRNGILMHHGNFYTDILGCILVGQEFVDIDGDGNEDVTNSIKTMKEINKILKRTVQLTIKASTIERRDVQGRTFTSH